MLRITEDGAYAVRSSSRDGRFANLLLRGVFTYDVPP